MFDTLEESKASGRAPLHPVDAADELLAILARIDQLEAQAAAALGQLNDAARWRRKGYTSATAFLKHRAAMSAARAMGLVMRANALEDMPHTATAFARGDLSVEQVDVLCGAYNFSEEHFTEDERMLVDLASQLPFVEEVYRLVAYWKQRIDPVATEVDQDMLNSMRGIRIRRDDGVGRAYVCLNEEELDIWINSLDPGPPAPEDRRTLAQRRVDRLVEPAAATMDRPQLVVHVGLDNLNGSDIGRSSTISLLLWPRPNPVPFSPRVPSTGWHATRRCAVLSSALRVRSSTWGAGSACSRHRCAVPSAPATSTAAFRAATGHHNGATCTTSCTGPAAARHVSKTAFSCAVSTTPLVHEAGWSITGTPNRLIVVDDLGRVYATSSQRRPVARAP